MARECYDACPVHSAHNDNEDKEMRHAGPSIRYNLTPERHQEALAILTQVENAEQPEKESEQLAKLITTLTKEGLEFFFLHPLRTAKVGIITMKTAEVGVAASSKVFTPVITKVVKSLNRDQVLSICHFMRDLIH